MSKNLKYAIINFLCAGAWYLVAHLFGCSPIVCASYGAGNFVMGLIMLFIS